MNYCADRYDAFYATPQARKENMEIRRTFRSVAFQASSWVDLGCGTGLGASFCPSCRGYVGVDIDKDMVARCRAKFPGRKFVCGDASYFVDPAHGVLSLFAINYLPWRAILDIALHPGPVFVVGYNRPFLSGSASAYAVHGKAAYRENVGVAKPRLIRALFRVSGFLLWPLCGEPYYYVATKEATEPCLAKNPA